MGDVTTSITFTSGQQVTAADLNNIMSSSAIAAGAIVNADVNASAGINLSKLETTDTMNAAAYQVGGTTVIDASQNLTNIAAATMTGLTTTDTLSVTDTAYIGGIFTVAAGATYAGTNLFTGTTQLHGALTTIGENSGDLVKLDGTFYGTPTFGGVTADFDADAVLGLDGGTTSGSIKAFPADNFQPKVTVAIYEHQETSGTAGGTATTGAWTKHKVNTEVSDLGGIGSIASDQITLDSGLYVIDVTASFYGTGQTKMRVYNATDTSEEFRSVNQLVVATQDGHVLWMSGIVNLGASKALELQYYVSGDPGNGRGLGYEQSNGTETYLQCKIIKIR